MSESLFQSCVGVSESLFQSCVGVSESPFQSCVGVSEIRNCYIERCRNLNWHKKTCQNLSFHRGCADKKWNDPITGSLASFIFSRLLAFDRLSRCV